MIPPFQIPTALDVPDRQLASETAAFVFEADASDKGVLFSEMLEMLTREAVSEQTLEPMDQASREVESETDPQSDETPPNSNDVNEDVAAVPAQRVETAGKHDLASELRTVRPEQQSGSERLQPGAATAMEPSQPSEALTSGRELRSAASVQAVTEPQGKKFIAEGDAARTEAGVSALNTSTPAKTMQHFSKTMHPEMTRHGTQDRATSAAAKPEANQRVPDERLSAIERAPRESPGAQTTEPARAQLQNAIAVAAQQSGAIRPERQEAHPRMVPSQRAGIAMPDPAAAKSAHWSTVGAEPRHAVPLQVGPEPKVRPEPSNADQPKQEPRSVTKPTADIDGGRKIARPDVNQLPELGQKTLPEGPTLSNGLQVFEPSTGEQDTRGERQSVARGFDVIAVAELRTAQSIAPAQALSQSAQLGDGKALMILRDVVERFSGGQAREIELQLNPKELGKLRFVMSLSESGQIVVNVSADRAETLDVMRRQGDALAQQMMDSGFENVSLEFGQNATGQDGSSHHSGESAHETEALESTEQHNAWVIPDARVDIRV